MVIKLQVLKESDVTQVYVDWFTNKNVIRFSNNSYRKFSLEGQKKYVNDCLINNDVELFGIFENNLHIGNIEINGLNSFHKRGEIKYVIGNTSYWGKGIGAFAVSYLIDLSKNKYNLNKLIAGTVRENIGSRKILEKNGFNLEGIRYKHVLYDGVFHDQLDYGLIL